MQAKDLSDRTVLEFLAERQGRWTMRWDIDPLFPGAPGKVVLAKIRALIRRKLSGGCDCGCRGDLEITDKGLAFIGRERVAPYTGYPGH